MVLSQGPDPGQVVNYAGYEVELPPVLEEVDYVEWFKR